MTTREQVRRYPGASPFQDRDLDRRAFFGRDRESRSLYHLVKAEQLVVLFAKSGVGKTSLINAGLLEPLRRQGFFPMVVRVNDLERGPIGSCLDGVMQAAHRARVDCVGGDESNLRSFFAKAEFWSEGQDLLRPVLILDQFEELFTLYPAAPRQEFSRQFAELIRHLPGPKARAGTPPRLKVVLSLREDYLANLEELARETPAVLHNRFRLKPLSREEARSAIVEPARLEDQAFRSTPFSYSDAAVRAILDFLARSRWGAETIETDEIEPFQLQLLCREAEEQAERKRSAGGPSEIEISADDLGGEDRMRQVLGRFYDRTVATVPSRRTARAVRRLCERRLISASGRRLTEDEDEIRRKYGLSKDRLHHLVDARLLRAEARLGGTFYELSHDTLVEPILESRKRRRRRRRGAAGLVAAALLLMGGYYVMSKFSEAEQARVERDETVDELVAKFSPSESSDPCAGWKPLGGYCYLFFEAARSFKDAQELCEKLAQELCEEPAICGQLVSIHSRQEDEYIVDLTGGAKVLIGGGPSEEALGKDSRGRWREGRGVWIDGSKWDYQNWRTEREPSGDGNCIMHVASGWNDFPCRDYTAMAGFVCKFPIPGNLGE